MKGQKEQPQSHLIINSLQERAKELRCIYEFEELFKKYEDKPLKEFFVRVERIIPPAFQYPDICHVIIYFDGEEFGSCDCSEKDKYLQTPIVVDGKKEGFLKVCYQEAGKEIFFLPEEKQLVNTIARRIGRFVFYKRLRENIELIKKASEKKTLATKTHEEHSKQSYWAWRTEMAQVIAEEIEPVLFGVKALYVIGSTKTGKAGPESDIDLMAHCVNDEEKQMLFKTWIEGWGKCLTVFYKEMTGIEIEGSIVDLHIITDEDISKKTSFGIMLSSVSNSAKLLKEYK